MHLSGKTVNLISEDYTATIVTMGGAIASLKYKGRNICVPFKPESIPIGHLGKILAPWPNRMIDGRYEHNGHVRQFPITEVKTNCALHGLVAWQEWRIKDANTDSLVLETYVNPIEAYPYLVKLTARYEVIDGMGLKVDIQALNLGKEDAPLGLGMHPFITCDLKPLTDCELSMPFKQCFSFNERKCPIDNVSVESLGFDFKEKRKIGDLHMDHCFIADESNRVNTVMLEANRLKVYLKTSAPYVQVNTESRIRHLGLGVEPMSCAPDAFNNKMGLIMLKEQQYYTLDFLIGAFEF